MNVLNLILGIIGAYALGMLPSAIVVARAKGIDITSFGSGNPGASNVARALGWKYGSLVFVLDAAKGALPTLLLIGHRPSAYVCGALAIVGHIFPITRGFKGGKGIATGAGVLLVLHPVIMVIAALSWIAIMKISKKASLASIVVVPLVIVLLVTTGKPTWEVLAFVGLGLLIEIRHLSNIKRLLSKSELPANGPQ